MKKELIFLGPPACGKGTQTNMLSDYLNFLEFFHANQELLYALETIYNDSRNNFNPDYLLGYIKEIMEKFVDRCLELLLKCYNEAKKYFLRFSPFSCEKCAQKRLVGPISRRCF